MDSRDGKVVRMVVVRVWKVGGLWRRWWRVEDRAVEVVSDPRRGVSCGGGGKLISLSGGIREDRV